MRTANVGTIQDQKERFVDSILENSAYLPESGMRRMIREKLLTLPKSVLSGLGIIINIKRADAIDSYKEMLKNTADIGKDAAEMERNADDWARKNPGAVMRAEEKERERQLKAGEI